LEVSGRGSTTVPEKNTNSVTGFEREKTNGRRNRKVSGGGGGGVGGVGRAS